MKIYYKLLTIFSITATITLSPLTAILSSGASYGKVDGNYQLLDGTKIEGVVARGIDVSHWQGVIDWSQVANDDVSFVMLGTRYSGKVDPNFHTNATNAANSGVKLGAYIYSYATTVEMALQEADFILDLVKDYPISYPIAYDLEDNVQSSLTPQEVSALANAFCERIEAAGYYPILYANDYWLANKIDLSVINYDVWVARYEIKHAFKNPVMWQATSTGSVNGIKGNVDIDFQYKDFSPLIVANRWRTIAGQTFYYKNFVMQKNTWIYDDTGWFYMNQDGLTHKGWLTANSQAYYLDSNTGKMMTGWKQLDQTWYYFNSSGELASGWINDNGTFYYADQNGKMQTGWLTQANNAFYLQPSGARTSGWTTINDQWYYFNENGYLLTGWFQADGNWYYANTDGKMQTGWLLHNNSYYYLKPSGAMTTGWRSLDNRWYYLNSSGVMLTGWINVNGTWYYTDQNGNMLTGWLNSQGQSYYLDPNSGAMAANTTLLIDGVTYSVDSSGICQQATEAVLPNEDSAVSAGEAPALVPAQPESPASKPAAIGPGIS